MSRQFCHSAVTGSSRTKLLALRSTLKLVGRVTISKVRLGYRCPLPLLTVYSSLVGSKDIIPTLLEQWIPLLKWFSFHCLQGGPWACPSRFTILPASLSHRSIKERGKRETHTHICFVLIRLICTFPLKIKCKN